jgi:hypothetical protein
MPMDAEPLVRARFCQEWLAFAAKEEDPWRSRFFALLGEETRELIDASSRVAWVPIALHVKLADVLQEAYGVVRAHSYYRRAFAASLSGPILGPLVRTGSRVLGIGVPTFVRWAPRGWEAAFRNAGGMMGEVVGPYHAKLTYFGLPPVCTASEGWMISSQGSAYGAYDVMGVDGVVRLDMSGRSEGRMVLDLEWNALGSVPPPPRSTTQRPPQ